jgi:ABC-type amino acid transport substrate-binding protein
LDPKLYNISETGAKYELFAGALNELAPAVLNREAELTLLDVPDTLVALGRWPGQLKVIGPISEEQFMATAFRKESAQLKEAYEAFLNKLRRDGRYKKLVSKYYPLVEEYFPAFFHRPE